MDEYPKEHMDLIKDYNLALVFIDLKLEEMNEKNLVAIIY